MRRRRWPQATMGLTVGLLVAWWSLALTAEAIRIDFGSERALVLDTSDALKSIIFATIDYAQRGAPFDAAACLASLLSNDALPARGITRALYASAAYTPAQAVALLDNFVRYTEDRPAAAALLLPSRLLFSNESVSAAAAAHYPEMLAPTVGRPIDISQWPPNETLLAHKEAILAGLAQDLTLVGSIYTARYALISGNQGALRFTAFSVFPVQSELEMSPQNFSLLDQMARRNLPYQLMLVHLLTTQRASLYPIFASREAYDSHLCERGIVQDVAFDSALLALLAATQGRDAAALSGTGAAPSEKESFDALLRCTSRLYCEEGVSSRCLWHGQVVLTALTSGVGRAAMEDIIVDYFTSFDGIDGRPLSALLPPFFFWILSERTDLLGLFSEDSQGRRWEEAPLAQKYAHFVRIVDDLCKAYPASQICSWAMNTSTRLVHWLESPGFVTAGILAPPPNGACTVDSAAALIRVPHRIALYADRLASPLTVEDAFGRPLMRASLMQSFVRDFSAILLCEGKAVVPEPCGAALLPTSTPTEGGRTKMSWEGAIDGREYCSSTCSRDGWFVLSNDAAITEEAHDTIARMVIYSLIYLDTVALRLSSATWRDIFACAPTLAQHAGPPPSTAACKVAAAMKWSRFFSYFTAEAFITKYASLYGEV